MRQGISQDGPKSGMMASYGEQKDKAISMTIGVAQQLEGHPAEPEVKKLRYNRRTQRKLQEKKEGHRRHRQQVRKSRVGKEGCKSHKLS
jgi:hypothetical protein